MERTLPNIEQRERAPNERLLKILQATPEVLKQIDRVLDGRLTPAVEDRGPLLLSMTAAATYLGCSRATCWRIRKSGQLPVVELLPGSYRVRRADLDAIASGKPVRS